MTFGLLVLARFGRWAASAAETEPDALEAAPDAEGEGVILKESFYNNRVADEAEAKTMAGASGSEGEPIRGCGIRGSFVVGRSGGKAAELVCTVGVAKGKESR